MAYADSTRTPGTRAVIGSGERGSDVTLDTERLISTRMLLTANSGGGKSWAIRRILEQTYGQVQHIVIDPESEFFTLRERFDYILAAPRGGECLAHPRTAKVMATKLLELGVSTVIDIFELEPHERRTFVDTFLRALINAPKRLWHPVLVVIDEAHTFAPQSAKGEAAGGVISLMTRGRKRGFAGILATQRIAKLHKDAAAECNNKLIGRCVQDIDMRRAAEELGLDKASATDLRRLRDGCFYAFGPAISDEVVQVQVGPIETTHPRVGSHGAPAEPPRDRQLAARILAELADLPAKAEDEARTVDELRRQVRELSVSLRRAEAARAEPSADAVEQARAEGAHRAEAAHGVFVARVNAHLEEVHGVVSRSEDLLSAARQRLETRFETALPAALDTPRPIPNRRDRPTLVPTVPTELAATNSASSVSGPQQRILDSLGWLESVGIERAKKTQLAFLADASPKSSAFANNLGRLRSSGLIDYPGAGEVALTDGGRAVSVAPDMPPTTDELQRSVLDRVSGPQGRILRALIQAYPDSIDKGHLASAAEASPSSSAFANNLGFLRSLGLIDYPTSGRVTALPILFLEAAGERS